MGLDGEDLDVFLPSLLYLFPFFSFLVGRKRTQSDEGAECEHRATSFRRW